MNNQKIQLKYLFDIFSGSTPETGKAYYWDGDISWITPEDISSISNGNIISDTKRKITNEGFNNSGVKLAKPGAIVFTKRAPIGNLAITEMEACCNQGCFLLEPQKETLSAFYYYYLLSQKSRLQSLGRGSTFMELSSDDFKTLQVPSINIGEQLKIAEFIDNEVSKIDLLIRLKEEQISRLNEKRQAIITKAVTQGINPDVELVDSGIDWLGEIPEEWKVSRVKFLGEITYGLSQPPEYYEVGIPLIRATNVQRGVINKDGLVFVDESEVPMSKKIKLQTGDIIVVRSGAYTGDSALIKEEWNDSIAGFDMVLRVDRNNVFPNFLSTVLLSEYVLDRQLIPESSRAAQPHLNAEELGNVIVLLPSLNEQISIMNFLNKELGRIDRMKELTAQTIVLLKERRSTLISAAVTGQLQIPAT